jgi:hypothetical protein
VFRAVEREAYDTALKHQVEHAKQSADAGDLDELFGRGDTWEVPPL